MYIQQTTLMLFEILLYLVFTEKSHVSFKMQGDSLFKQVKNILYLPNVRFSLCS